MPILVSLGSLCVSWILALDIHVYDEAVMGILKTTYSIIWVFHIYNYPSILYRIYFSFA